MANTIKIFGLEIRVGNTPVDLEKVDKLLLKTAADVRQAKKDWIEYSKTLSSMKGHALILQFMREFETKAKSTTIARRTMTAEEKVATRQARESAKAEEMKVLAEKSRIGSIRQLEAEISRLNILWKEASKADRNSTVGKKVTTQLTTLRKELRETKMAAGDFTNNIGNYMSAIFNRTTMMVAGISAAVYSLKHILYTVFAPFQDLEYRMAMVKAVSRATDEEFVNLTHNARYLGATTEYTATEVAGLQLAYARMGFVPEQIMKITGATLDLATATGEDLAKSADVVGVTLKGFNLAADQTQRVVDVMTKAFNSSSLQLDYFYESIKYVAPIASQANVSLEQTAAMLGILADRGIRGSQAGTALRRILTEISVSGGTVSERLDQLSKSGITLGGAMDEVGRYAMTALTVLANSKDGLDNLSASLTNAGSSAKTAADGIRDTMKIDIEVFISAIQEKLIDLGETLAPLARGVIRAGTAFVSSFKEIALAIAASSAAVAIWNLRIKAKIALARLSAFSDKASALATALNSASLSGNTAALIRNSVAIQNASAMTKAYAVVKLLLTGNIKAATVAMKSFTAALARNPLGLIAVALSAVVSYFVFFRKGADEATDAQKRFNDESDRYNKAQDEKRQRAEQLIAVIQNETETAYAKIKAYEELRNLSPALTDAYTQEQLAVLGLAKTSKLLNEQQDKEHYDDQRAKLSRLVEVYNQLEAACGDWNRAKLTEEERARYSGQTTQNAQEAVKVDIEIYQNGVREIERLQAEAKENLKPIKIRIAEADANVDKLSEAFEFAGKVYEREKAKWIKDHGTTFGMPIEFRLDVWGIGKQLSDAKKKAAELLKQNKNSGDGGNGDGGKDKGEWSLSKDQNYNAQMLALKKQLYNGELASEELYQKQVLQLEIDTIARRIALNKDESKEIVKLKSDLLDKQNQQIKANKKSAEAFDASRKASADTAAKYEIEHREAAISAMEECVDKKIKLNDLSTDKAIASANKEYFAELEKLNKEQAANAKEPARVEEIEKEKNLLTANYDQKHTDIKAAGANKRLLILKDATEDELREYAKIPEVAADAERQITENKAREVTKRLELSKKELAGADNKFTQNEAIADVTYGTDLKDKDRHAARLRNEIALREAKAQTYIADMAAMQEKEQTESDAYFQAITNIGRLKQESENLAKGLEADGSGGGFNGWLTRAFEIKPDDIRQLEQQAWDLASRIGNAMIDAQQQASQRRLRKEKKTIDAQYKTEAKLLDSKRDKGLITEKQYQKELERLEEAKAAREEAAEKAAFERKKKLDIKQVLINTALSIAKTFAQMGYPWGIPFALLAAAEGAIQVGVISAQKYANGGIIPVGDKMGVVTGRSHSEGGNRIYIDGTPIGEIERDELIAIVNKHDTARIGALSAINGVHGRKFAQGGLVTSSGYMVSNVSPPAHYQSTTTQDNTAYLARIAELMMDQIQAINTRIDNIKVAVLAQDITDNQNEIKKIKVKSSW